MSLLGFGVLNEKKVLLSGRELSVFPEHLLIEATIFMNTHQWILQATCKSEEHIKVSVPRDFIMLLARVCAHKETFCQTT